MPVFKKSPTTKKENETNLDDFGTNQAVKQLDSRLCMDCYRDFYTVKNYWKTVVRRWKEACGIFMQGFVFFNWP